MSIFNQVLVVDTETGGLDPNMHAVLSVGLVSAYGELEILINDMGICTPEALAVNGIDLREHEAHALQPYEAAQLVAGHVGSLQAILDHRKLWVAGHNVAFDIGFVQRLFRLAARDARARELPEVPIPRCFAGFHRTIDTHTLLWALHARDEIPYEATNSTGAFEYFDIGADGRHTAIGDARATLDLLRKLV